MKTKLILLAATMLVSFAGFAQAQAATVKNTSTEKAKCPADCTKKCCPKKEKCSTDCKKKCCAVKSKCPAHSKKSCGVNKANVTHINVSGMTCGGCSKKLTTALAAIKGVKVKKVCHKSGCVDVVLSNGTTATQVKEVITKTGFKVAPKKKTKG